MAGGLGLALVLTWIGILVVLARGYRRNRGNFSLTPSPIAPSFVSNAKTAPQPVPSSDQPHFVITAPEHLPKFSDVGGMDKLKQELQDTVGLLLKHADEAEAYRITWNGLLLQGPPGVGKSFMARAMAGEFGLNFLPIQTSDLSTGAVVNIAFSFATAHLPCLLFFDELDAIAEARADDPNRRGRDVLTQLLQSLENYREEHKLVVVAATNDVDALDPAVVRAGRFDRQVRIDLPDTTARESIFKCALAGRPVAKDLDLPALASRTTGCTPATITHAVESAALTAFRHSAGTGKVVRINQKALVEGLEHGKGEDRPTVEDWSWDRLVLPARTLAELQELQTLVEDPGRSTSYGVDPPTGVLLTGPPGTGKTTIAKVLAAEASCSFYPVSAADVTSRWVGESERAIARLFRRARANAPSIVFIDEIDAIAGTRGQFTAYDRQLDQLLQEMDGMTGQRGLLVIGATNRASALDPALLRGGRLSRTIQIPKPDVDGRRAILELLTAHMPLQGVDLDDVALETEGFSGADLKALCQQAAVEAMVRNRSAGTKAATITPEDVEHALHAGNGESKKRPLRSSRRS
jgi:transitional endoplasmic reticulum ATPase